MNQSEEIFKKLDGITQFLAERNKYRFAEHFLYNDEFIAVLRVSKK